MVNTKGAHGLVKKVCLRSDSSKLFCAKIIRSDDEEVLIAIEEEYRILALLNHPGIVRAADMYVDKTIGKIVYVMEYFNGISLTFLR